MSKKPLSEQVVVVTGASAGLARRVFDVNFFGGVNCYRASLDWKGQHTGEDKPVGSPDNLFEPVTGDKGARGRFSGKSRSSTLWTSLRLRRFLIGAAVAGVGLASMGITNSREKPLVR